MLDKLDHAVENEVKEEMKENGDFYEDDDLEVNSTIHYSNLNFKPKRDANDEVKVKKVDNYMES
jgi:hypothetical protein